MRKGHQQSRERRRGRRDPCPPAEETFVEIEHSFGREKLSVYPVVEHDEHGLSFLVPHDDGYFLPGTPLRFTVIPKDSMRVRHVGISVYHNPVYTSTGEKFFHIGVEIRSSLRQPPRQKYTLRPPRVTGSRRMSFRIRFTLGGQSHAYELEDFSRFSASFICSSEELLALPLSSLLSDVGITTGKEVIFDGEATIVKIYDDSGGRHRVVVEPRMSPIDLDRVGQAAVTRSVSEGADSLIRRHDNFESIDSTFKAMVADLRFFLEDFRDYLGSPIFKIERREPSSMLAEIFPPFYDKVDRKVRRLDTYTGGMELGDDESSLYKHYYQKNLLPLFAAGSYNHRVYFKPHGYPGDFEMMRMVHANAFEGSTLFGRMIHRYSTSIPIAEAVRDRTNYFRQRLGRAMTSTRGLRVLSVASGPALEIDMLLKEDPGAASGASVTLLDQEGEALQFSMESLYELRLRSGTSMELTFLHTGLGNFVRDIAKGRIHDRYDFIYSSGLFDYFDDRTSISVIRRLVRLLSDSGRLVVANLSLDGHDHRIFMEFGHEWKLIYRSEEDMVRLAEATGVPGGGRVTGASGGILKLLEMPR